MSIRKVSFAEGEYYHIFNRGNSKQKIFHDEKDYFHFMKLLFLCNNTDNLRTFNISRAGIEIFNDEGREKIVSIGAYCLMPNHFHIYITELIDNGISKFMQKLSTAYVMYYNKKYKHSGSLFEGKFKSVHIENEREAKYLFSYIHLNPIKLIDKGWKEKGIKNKREVLKFLEGYQYSSYLDFISIGRVYKNILDITAFPKYFPSRSSFMKEVFEWLNYSNE